MSSTLVSVQNRFATVAPHGTLEIAFDPGAAGVIKASSTVARFGLFGGFGGSGTPFGPFGLIGGASARKTELITPTGVVVETKTGAEMISSLAHTVSAADVAGTGRWTLRVTNLGTRPLKLGAHVSFPTSIPIKTKVIPLATINAGLALLLSLGQLKLHLESGENPDDKRSFFDVGNAVFRQELGQRGMHLPLRFYVPKKTISIFLLPDPVVRLKDVNTSSVSVSVENATPTFRNGLLHLSVVFEEQGTELVVDNGPDADIRRMNLTVDLSLAAQNGLLSYSVVDARFPVDVDIHGPFEWLIELIVDVSKLLRRTVE